MCAKNVGHSVLSSLKAFLCMLLFLLTHFLVEVVVKCFRKVSFKRGTIIFWRFWQNRRFLKSSLTQKWTNWRRKLDVFIFAWKCFLWQEELLAKYIAIGKEWQHAGIWHFSSIFHLDWCFVSAWNFTEKKNHWEAKECKGRRRLSQQKTFERI